MKEYISSADGGPSRKPRVAWLASYPKSGNTWLRFVLSEILYRGEIQRSQDLFSITPIDTIPASMLPPNQLNFVKTHSVYHRAQLEGAEIERAVLVVRNPTAVMLSNLRYAFLTGGGAPVDGSFPEVVKRYLNQFILHGGDPRWCEIGYGTWAEHSRSWLDQTDIPVLCVRYEDMRRDMVAKMKEVCRFLGIVAASERIESAVHTWSFEAMRRLEEDEIIAGVPGMFVRPGYERAHQQGFRFVGSRGSPLEGLMLPPDVSEWVSAFEPLYSRLDYRVDAPVHNRATTTFYEKSVPPSEWPWNAP